MSGEGGLNLYGFCRNDGVNKWDVLGMKPDWNANVGEVYQEGNPGEASYIQWVGVDVGGSVEWVDWESASRMGGSTGHVGGYDAIDAFNAMIDGMWAENDAIWANIDRQALLRSLIVAGEPGTTATGAPGLNAAS